MIKILKKYKFLIISLIGITILFVVNKTVGIIALKTAGSSLKQMLLILPPIFILLGLLDVWVPKNAMVEYLGHGSGVKGIVLSFFLGSMAAGPLYGAFPLIAVLMKKGARLLNIIIILGAWSTTKIPMLVFEFSTLGVKFALTRLLIDIPGIIIMAFIITKFVSPKEEEEIIKKVSLLE